MKKNLTEIIFILDKSGSMSGLEKDTIGGFNSLLEKQAKEEGEALVSTVLFSDTMEVIHDRVDIKQVPKLTDKEYFVSGCTALLDAMGNSINHIKKVYASLEEHERPEKTLFIITTDGQENSSREFTYQKLKKLIESSKESNGFEFIFLGANIDAVEEASRFGIDADNAVDYKCDATGIQTNFMALDEAIKCTRVSKKLSKTWRKSIDNDLKNRK